MKCSVALVALAACSGSSATAPSQHALPFIDNALEVARLEANVRHVPLFVEVWAPW
jgi:hypothetical protein